MLKVFVAAALAPLVLHLSMSAQTCSGRRLAGVVRDTTAALVPGATVALDGKTTRTSGPDGRFSFACVSAGKHMLTATFRDFAPYTINVTAPHAGELTFRLVPSAEASITVNADADMPVAAPGGSNSIVLAGRQLQALADDPDDLLRELQQLSAASGGSPSNAVISVDGFQDAAQLPPKDSIAYINVNPDLFSAEYREPPFGGGRVEVYTKPGAKAYHGSLFTTNSSSWMNASDPFTTTTGSIGKQRYGFDFTGPVRRQGSNFSLNLEHRSIDETVAVNAITLDSNGNQVNTLDTVPIPQRLWIGNARLDWQFGAKSFAFVSFSANVNHLENLGVGGQTLREAGYDSGTSDYTERASDVTTISPKLVHEARVSFEHVTADDIPSSTAPSLQVEGYFTGGGATIGNERDSHSHIEFDDDIILNTKNQLIKAGFQLLYFRRNYIVPTYFNGAYIFSGSATTGSAYVSALQQYQQALAGGTATEFNNVAGNPNVITTQVRFAAFYQDNIKLNDTWSAFYGLRYALETDPAAFNGIAPRGGVSYSPDKKHTWLLKAHFGLFNGQISSDEAQELHREDGVQRITSLIYNPTYGAPFTNATPIHAERTLAPGFHLPTFVLSDLSISKDLPLGFSLHAEEVFIQFLTASRTVNVNQPLGPNPTPSPYGPRPIAPNLDILQARNDGSGAGHGDVFGFGNSKLKHAQFFLGAVHIDIHDNTDSDNLFFQPQSAYTNAGEGARRDNQGEWQIYGNANITLPYKLSLSSNGYASGRQPFNILTGSDNNGDGDFNDRPQFAPAGTAANGTTIFQTPFGLLTNTGAIINGIPVAPIRRDLGVLPWSFNLDANLQRAFDLTKDPKATHQQTLTANVRSANFLNHTNVTSEDNVLGSPQFLLPIAAGTARRIEFGLRYSF